jgi:hypothetical protein
MGMVIVDKSKTYAEDGKTLQSPEDMDVILETDYDKIYYFSNGRYYRKGKSYDYIEVDYKFTKVELTESNYIADVYYY